MRSRFRILLPLTYMVGIIVLSSIPGSTDQDSQSVNLDWLSSTLQNFLHIPLYGGLAACWYWTIGAFSNDVYKKVWGALVITVTFSGFDEIYQSTVAGRSSSVTDILLDVGGILLALAIMAKTFGTNPDPNG